MRIAFVGGLGLALVVAQCSSSGDLVTVPVPPIIATKGALDGVTRLTVSVFDAAAVQCNDDPKSTTRGQITGTAQPLASKDLGNMNCAGGAKWCGDIQVEKSSAKRVISAEAFAGNTKRAAGCATLVIDKDQIQQAITVYRILPPATCGGKPSPYPAVQCSMPGNDVSFVCDAECLSKEMYLSKGTGGAGETSDTKDKLRPSFVWPASSDPSDGRFLAFFGDMSQSGRPQVSMRVLSPDMTACVSGACSPDRGPTVRDFSFFIPNDMAGTIPSATQGDASTQLNPAATFAGGKYIVAFENGGPAKIAVRTYNSAFGCDQAANMALQVSTQNGTLPAIAAGAGKVMIVWQAGDGIHGRTLDPSTLMLGAEQTIAGSGSTNASVAATAAGFVVAYKNGADVKLRATDASGAPTGMEIKVNDVTHMGAQESPAVAALPDGRVAVVWIDTGAPGGAGVFVQRFDRNLVPVPMDQAKRINDLTQDATCAQSTIVSGSSGADSFFAAAWVNTTTGHVHARFIDATSGFLFNPVTGQSSEFQASRDDGPTRANPTIAIGGAGPYVAIGWEDNSGTATGTKCNGTITMGAPPASCKGIFARRFPVPTK
jgi:hypothetical protein